MKTLRRLVTVSSRDGMAIKRSRCSRCALSLAAALTSSDVGGGAADRVQARRFHVKAFARPQYHQWLTQNKRGRHRE